MCRALNSTPSTRKKTEISNKSTCRKSAAIWKLNSQVTHGSEETSKDQSESILHRMKIKTSPVCWSAFLCRDKTATLQVKEKRRSQGPAGPGPRLQGGRRAEGRGWAALPGLRESNREERCQEDAARDPPVPRVAPTQAPLKPTKPTIKFTGHSRPGDVCVTQHSGGRGQRTGRVQGRPGRRRRPSQTNVK